MDCKELGQPSLLTIVFRENNERELNRVFKCFHENYYRIFIFLLYKISRKHKFLQNDPDFYGSQAFNDGLLTFYDKINKNGFIEGKAKLKTFFFSFCLNKLKAIISEHVRNFDKQTTLIQDDKYLTININIEEDDLYNEQETLLQKAMDMLDVRKKQYIILRKIYNLKNEEIAVKMGIEPSTVKNEVYKSVLKLKEKIESLKAKTQVYGNYN